MTSLELVIEPQNAANDSIEATSSSMTSESRMFFLLLPLLPLFSWLLLRSWWRKMNSGGENELGHLPLPPGSSGLPILGETIAWITQGAKFNSDRRKRFGNVFRTNVICLPMVKVTGREFVKEVLEGEHETVTTIWPATVRKLLGENGIVSSTGSVHKYKRKITLKAFTLAALDSYVPRIRRGTEINIKKLCDVTRPRIYDRMLRLGFDVTVGALLGFDVEERSELDGMFSHFNDLVDNLFCVPLDLPGFGYRKGLRARKAMLKILAVHIENKRKKIRAAMDSNSGPPDHEAALDIILREEMKQRSSDDVTMADNDEHRLSEIAIQEMAMELMFTGYFTSASAVTSTILELSRNPDVFRKVEQEMLALGFLSDDDGDCDVTDEPPELTLDAIHKLKYLDRVIKESMRLRPPVLGGYRRARKTFQLGEYRIPKGWTVIYNIRDTHDFEYDGVTSFDPDRFDADKDSKYRYIPFGGGPRKCIGQEYAKVLLKTILIEMFRRFRGWELTSGELPKMKAIPTLHPADGLPLDLYPREVVGVVGRR